MFQRKCISKMRDVTNSHGKTVLFVSHNMQSISKLCQRTAIIETGTITFAGDTEQAITEYASLNSASSAVSLPTDTAYCVVEELAINEDAAGAVQIGVTISAKVDFRAGLGLELDTSMGVKLARVSPRVTGNHRQLQSGDTARLELSIAPLSSSLNAGEYQLSVTIANVGVEELVRFDNVRSIEILAGDRPTSAGGEPLRLDYDFNSTLEHV